MVIKSKTTLNDLQPGSVFMSTSMGQTSFGFKSEYRTTTGAIEAYCLGSGEMFWGGTKTPKDQGELEVFELILNLQNFK